MQNSEDDAELARALDQAEPRLREALAGHPDVVPEWAEEPALLMAADLYSLGFQDARRMTPPGDAFDTTSLRTFDDAVRGMDEVMLDLPERRDLANVRNALATRADALRTGYLARTKEAWSARYGADAARILGASTPPDEDEAADLGVAVLASQAVEFYGYVMHHDDSALSCRCVGHCATAFIANGGHTRDSVEKAIAAKFGNRITALRRFGWWHYDSMRNLLRDALAGKMSTIGHIDMREVDASGDYIANIMRRGSSS